MYALAVMMRQAWFVTYVRFLFQLCVKLKRLALRERHGEVQVEVPVEIAAFLLNEKRHSLVYLEQTSGVRVTVPHPH